MKIKFLHSITIAKDIKSFYFDKPINFRYNAGQFIELTLPHTKVDERGEKRWFTISSAPSEEHLCITTKIIEKRSSFKNALNSLKAGDTITISEVMGDFILPKDSSLPLIFIAGGIGVTPYRSMIRWLTDTNSERSIELLYFAPNESHIAFRNDLQTPFTKITYITDGSKLSAQSLKSHVKDINHKLIYISGPEQMAEALVSDLVTEGFDKYRIITDYFPGYKEI